MKALIDSDYFAYAHGAATDDEGRPLAWPLLASRINQQIKNIVTESGADTYELYLTGSGNFRDKIGTIRPYKGNRTQEKPYHYQRIRDYLIKFRKATLVEGIEADDRVSIEQFQAKDRTTVICTVDKDLDNTPGLHYSWINDKAVYYVDQITAIKNFYKQVLTGDTVDNIPGLFGVGKSSSHLKHVDDSCNELECYKVVQAQYEKRFGSYWKMFLIENATLLWMLRVDNTDECRQRLECLEGERQISIEASLSNL